MAEQVKARKGQPFDSEAMTTLTMELIKVLVKALYLEYKIDHEAQSMKREQQDTDIEMSNKMKSEVGLDAFLAHVSGMETIYQQDCDGTLVHSKEEQGKAHCQGKTV